MIYKDAALHRPADEKAFVELLVAYDKAIAAHIEAPVKEMSAARQRRLAACEAVVEAYRAASRAPVGLVDGELAELSRKATQGEWAADYFEVPDPDGGPTQTACDGVRTSYTEGGQRVADAGEINSAFIAGSVNFVRRHLAFASSTQPEAAGQAVTLTYTNWEGETADRTIFPTGRMLFTSNKWHPEPQWLVEASGVGFGGVRLFALSGFNGAPKAATQAGDASGGVDVALKEVERLVGVYGGAQANAYSPKLASDQRSYLDIRDSARHELVTAIYSLAAQARAQALEEAAKVAEAEADRLYARGGPLNFFTERAEGAALAACAIRSAGLVPEVSARPAAWMRGVYQPSSPNGPAEYDADFVHGDDKPEGDGWIALFTERAIRALSPQSAPPGREDAGGRLTRVVMPNGDILEPDSGSDPKWASCWLRRDPDGRTSGSGIQDWELVEQYGLTAILDAALKVNTDKAGAAVGGRHEGLGMARSVGRHGWDLVLPSGKRIATEMQDVDAVFCGKWLKLILSEDDKAAHAEIERDLNEAFENLFIPRERVSWHLPPFTKGTVLKHNGGMVKVQWDTGEVRRDEPEKLRRAPHPDDGSVKRQDQGQGGGRG